MHPGQASILTALRNSISSIFMTLCFVCLTMHGSLMLLGTPEPSIKWMPYDPGQQFTNAELANLIIAIFEIGTANFVLFLLMRKHEKS